MPTDIDYREVRRLMQAGGQIVEVLPEAEYGEEHLPGAINLPLKQVSEKTASVLDRNRPVAVYYHDYQ